MMGRHPLYSWIGRVNIGKGTVIIQIQCNPNQNTPDNPQKQIKKHPKVHTEVQRFYIANKMLSGVSNKGLCGSVSLENEPRMV